MANRLYNKQISPKGYMKGGRVKKNGWRNDEEKNYVKRWFFKNG